MSLAARRGAPAVMLSTASVFPEPVRGAFELAAELGYDGVELMVWSDPTSQDEAAVNQLAEQYRIPVAAVHAPCTVVTQRIWEADPAGRLRRAAAAARALGAPTVVVHPPFRWQRSYARRFAELLDTIEQRYSVRMAVENMFPLRRGRLHTVPYVPGHDPTEAGHRHYTLDLSHTAASGADALAVLERMGTGLVHVHLADGTGSTRDEHLVPGRGGQPCAEVCTRLAAAGFAGAVVVEVSTRRCRDRTERSGLLAEALLFARLHLQPEPGHAPVPGRG